MSAPVTYFDNLLAKIPVDEVALNKALQDFVQPKRQYIIYMTPRTGSSWLRDVLRSTNLLGWPDEWFSTDMLPAFCKSLNANSLDAYTTLQRSQGQSPNGVFGVTINWHDLPALWPDIITNPRSGFFRNFPATETFAFSLHRRDIVAQAVSIWRVTQTGVFDVVNSTPEKRAEAEKNFYYDEGLIQKWLDHIATNERSMLGFFKAHDIKPRTLVYEDVTAAGAREAARFFVNAVAPDAPIAFEAASRHEKIATDKSSAFAERFRLDHPALVDEIEDRRRDIFENAEQFDRDQEVSIGVTPAICTRSDARESNAAVIIPVFGGFSSVHKCIESAINGRGDADYDIIVIYDSGPDPRIEALLDDYADRGLIELTKNEKNLGFVKSVNRGIGMTADKDIVILNSDAIVPQGWMDRMLSLAESDPKIATITPFTNNGEICSFPNFCHASRLPDDMGTHELDALFSAHGSREGVELPTGVGFCMYMSRAAINEIGLFDEETFGRGYGEENDFCRRAAAAGFRNVLQQNLFVYHAGNVSFGSERQHLAASAVKEVERLHPGYLFKVQEHIRENPARAERFRMALHYLSASDKPIVLIIAHGAGGGTRRYINELRNYFSQDVNYLWLEPSQPGWVRLIFPAWAFDCDQTIELSTGKDFLFDIFRYVGVDLIHINHIQGIADLTAEVIRELGVTHQITLHDFYFIGRNPTLTDIDGRYTEENRKHARLIEDVENESYDRLVRVGHEILRSSAKRIAPSREVVEIYHQHFPDLEIDVHEHIGTELVQKAPPVRIAKRDRGSALRVCVIGALGKEKGADILEAVAVLAKKMHLGIEFHLLGYAYRTLDESVTVHGAYEDYELQSKLADLRPQIVWFPCQWPETYSYTLTSVIEAGLPVLAPALGAFKSRTAGRPYTWLYDFHMTPADQLTLINARLREIEANGPAVALWENQPGRAGFYSSGAYLPERRARDEARMAPQQAAIEQVLGAQAPLESGWRRLFAPILWRLRANRHAARVWFDLLPSGARNALKRVLIG
ncbi:MAG: Stf0 family sulfotransferase [Pseudomonadota bacterium]